MKKTVLFIFFIVQQQVVLSSQANIYGEQFRGIFELEDLIEDQELSVKDSEFQKNCLHQDPEIQKEKSLPGPSDFDTTSTDGSSEISIGSLLSNGSFVLSIPNTDSLQKKRTLADYIARKKNNTQA